MGKSYLVIEKGHVDERIFPFGGRVTIGRIPECGIALPDPSVSRTHAAVYTMAGIPVIEDLGSHNGTFVNGQRVRKAVLYTGDVIQIGNVTFRFLQHETDIKRMDLLDSGEILNSEISVSHDDLGPKRSQSLSEAIGQVPIFSHLDREKLELLCRFATLLVYDRGRDVLGTGDLPDAIYIILEGTVEVLDREKGGGGMSPRLLEKGDFFGESSLITGSPQTATFRAKEETLVCALSFEAVRKIMQRVPELQGLLEKGARQGYCKK